MDDKKLLEKALEWYQLHDYYKAALELFPEEVLKKELKTYNKRKYEEKLAARKQELQEVLEQCKEKFPIGTLMWSDEGSDHCPNIVISEPYIGESDWHMPHDVFGYRCDNGYKMTVLAETVRISSGKAFQRDVIGLERCLRNMNRSDNLYKNHIINLDEYHKQETEKRNNSIKDSKKNIKHLEDELAKEREYLNELKSYHPLKFTEERIQEIAIEYKEKREQ